MKDKSKVFHFFVNFYKMVQRQFESPIKRLHSDNGREYVNQNLSKFLQKNGVVHELTWWTLLNKWLVAKRYTRTYGIDYEDTFDQRKDCYSK